MMALRTDADAGTITEAHEDAAITIHFDRIRLQKALGLKLMSIGKVILVEHKAGVRHKDGGTLLYDEIGSVPIGQLDGLSAQPVRDRKWRE